MEIKQMGRREIEVEIQGIKKERQENRKEKVNEMIGEWKRKARGIN
jgi:hypothetical protein